MKRPLAVVTMTYNEPVMLPIWARYYAEQVGPHHCYVIDHGSHDGSVEQLDRRIHVRRLSRTALNEAQRVEIVKQTTDPLLERYERVLYTDVDEIVVADPAQFDGLLGYCRRRHADVITVFGSNLVHDLDHEPPLDLSRTIMRQRTWMQANGFLCKPMLIDRPVSWSIGFHLSAEPTVFDDLFMFHLAYMDKSIIQERQKKRNAAVPVDVPWSHHGYSPEFVLEHMRQFFLPHERIEVSDITCGSPERDAFTALLFADPESRRSAIISNLSPLPGLWRIPERFRDTV